MKRTLAPVGVRISPREATRTWTADSKAESEFRDALARRLECPHVFLFSMGRAALTVLLKALAAKSERHEVVIPAYTCFSVASSVVRAGLKVRLCDIHPETLDYDPDCLDAAIARDPLAVVVVHLLGLPADIASVLDGAKQRGIAVIDDAAQALGADVADQPCGGQGNAGILSFGRGKPLTTWEGGAIVTRDEALARAISEKIPENTSPGPFNRGLARAKLLAYSILLRPDLYWLPKSMPFLGLGKTEFDPGFKIAAIDPGLCRVGCRTLKDLDSLNAARREKANYLMERLSDIPGLRIPRVLDSANPIYLRFPVLARDRSQRDHLFQKLETQGLGAGRMYPSTIRAIPGIEKHLANPEDKFPGAECVAENLLTLPTHQYVQESDLQAIVEAVQ